MPVQENFTEKWLVARNYVIMKEFLGLRQADVAKGTGISKQNLSTWEKRRGDPGAEFVTRLSNFFGLPRELFYKEDLTLDYLKNQFSMKNHTSVQEGSDNKEKEGPGQALMEFAERNKDYKIIPATVLEGEYRLMPLAEAEQSRKERDEIVKLAREAVQAKQELIDQLKARITELERLATPVK